MIGLILCTHSDLAKEFANAIEMIAGKHKNFDAVCFHNGDSIEELQETLKKLGEKYSSQNIPYCYLVDMLGATPFNSAVIASRESDANIISGVNLSLVLELLTSRDMFDGNDLNKFLKDIVLNAKESMQVIKLSEYL